MNTLICYLTEVPDVVWAALIASALTLTGVILTNWQFASRQRAQLQHDSEKSEAERKYSLRENVYLSATEAVATAYQQLINISNVDLAKTNPAEKLDDFFVSNSKASLVASDSTSRAIGDFLVAYTGVFFELLAMTSDIQAARVDRDLSDEDYREHQNEVSRILGSMTQFNEEAKADSEVWLALNRNLEFNMTEAEKAADARSEAWTRLNNAKVEFLRAALPKVRGLSEFAVPALVAMRSELEISTDIEAYRADYTRRFEKIESQLETFIAKILADAV